jgi:hypothetical protein
MWKVAALFQGHSPTWCLLLRSFVSCEEDERSEVARYRGTAHYNQFLTKEGCKPSEMCSRLKK